MNHKTKAFLITTIIGVLILFFTYSKLGISETLLSFENFTFKVAVIYLAAVILIEFFLVYRWNIVLKA